MDLLSDAALWVAVALVVVAVAGGGVLTTVIPRRWWGALINAVVIAVAGAMIALAAGLALNREYGWYPTLADLFPSTTTASTQQGAKTVQYAGNVTTSDTRSLPPLASGTARQFVVDIPSSEGKRSWPVTVVLPADYFDPASATKAYPVLMGAHGAPGSMRQWLEPMRLPERAAELVKAREIRPFILVLPSIMPTNTDTQCIYGPDSHTQVETWLARDVPQWIKTHLRAAPERQSWAWIGFSAGAWCSTMLTMRHPDSFGAAISMGGYYRPWWAGQPPAELRNDKSYLLDGVAATNPPPVSLWVQTSRRDKDSFPSTETFLAKVRPPMAVTSIIDPSGGHALVSWLPHVPGSLRWLAKTLPGFAPVP